MRAAFAGVLDEALSIFALPSARLELSLRVRRARPATPRDLLLHAMVRLLYERGAQARRVAEESRTPLRFEDLFPELPIVLDDALLLVGPNVVGAS